MYVWNCSKRIELLNSSRFWRFTFSDAHSGDTLIKSTKLYEVPGTRIITRSIEKKCKVAFEKKKKLPPIHGASGIRSLSFVECLSRWQLARYHVTQTQHMVISSPCSSL